MTKIPLADEGMPIAYHALGLNSGVLATMETKRPLENTNVNSVAHQPGIPGLVCVQIHSAIGRGYLVTYQLTYIMEKKRNVVAEIKSSIQNNPVLAYYVGLGSLKAKPSLKHVEAILRKLGKGDEDAKAIRQDCHNVLNRIGQLSGSLMKGNVGSVRGFRSGTIMSSQRGTKVGDIIATAMHLLTEQAYIHIKEGVEPTYLMVPDGDTFKYQWEAMCSVLKRFGFTGFDRKYDAVHEFFTKQLEVNGCLELVEEPKITENSFEFETAEAEAELAEA